MKKALNTSFIFCLVAALALALCYVAIQAVAVITANGALTIWAEDNLEAPVCIMCSIAAIITFGMSYIFKWKPAD